ncbi:MAG: DUF420 domain-containing protein [Vicinamibacteria bacterium]
MVAGWVLVRTGHREAHRRVMLAALATSTLFLASYQGLPPGWARCATPSQGIALRGLLAVLTSHTILAAVIVPLVIVTLARALRGRFDAHRRLARVTLLCGRTSP